MDSGSPRRWLSGRGRTLLVLAPVIVVSLFGMYQVLHYTRRGLATVPDSANYLGMAENLRHGHGPTVPFTFLSDDYSVHRAAGFLGRVPSPHFPPGYPLALAAISTATRGTQHAARLLDVVCAGVNLLLVGLMAARMTRYRSAVIAVIPPLLVLLITDAKPALGAAPWFTSHLSVASEPLGTLCFTAAILVASTAISTAGRASWYALAGAGVLAAATVLTRYVGGAAVVTIAIALVAFDARRPLRDRFIRTGAFTAVAVAPIAAYELYDSVKGGGTRTVAYHPKRNAALESLKVLGHGVFPLRWPDPLVIVLVSALGACAIVAAVWLPRYEGPWHDDTEGTTLLRVALLGVPVYIVVMWAAETFFDTNISMTPRHFVPIRGIVACVLVAGFYRLVTTWAPRRVVAIAILGVVLVDIAAGLHDTEQTWVNFPPAAVLSADRAVSALPRDALLVSNAPDHVYLTSHRPSLVVPSRRNYITGATNKRYAQQVVDIANLLRARRGYLFQTGTLYSTATADEVGRLVPLQIVARDDNSTLYAVAASP